MIRRIYQCCKPISANQSEILMSVKVMLCYFRHNANKQHQLQYCFINPCIVSGFGGIHADIGAKSGFLFTMCRD
jgi:hypothetical protein